MGSLDDVFKIESNENPAPMKKLDNLRIRRKLYVCADVPELLSSCAPSKILKMVNNKILKMQ